MAGVMNEIHHFDEKDAQHKSHRHGRVGIGKAKGAADTTSLAIMAEKTQRAGTSVVQRARSFHRLKSKNQPNQIPSLFVQ